MNSGLDSWCELTRLQKLEIFYQIIVILSLDSLLELGELLVDLLYHLAGEFSFMLNLLLSELSFKFLVEVRDVFSENIFKTDELLHFETFPLEIYQGAKSLVSSRLLLRKQTIF